MKETRTTYNHIAPQIVGNADKWGYAYYFDNVYFSSVKKARTEGIKERGHDDFFVAEFKGEKCVAVHIEEKGRFEETSEDFGEYVRGVNDELGII